MASSSGSSTAAPCRRRLALPAARSSSRPPGPNPASERTAFRLTAATATDVRVTLTDALGRPVGVLHDGLVTGEAVVPVDLSRLAPGLYVVRAEGTGVAATRTLTRPPVALRART